MTVQLYRPPDSLQSTHLPSPHSGSDRLFTEGRIWLLRTTVVLSARQPSRVTQPHESQCYHIGKL